MDIHRDCCKQWIQISRLLCLLLPILTCLWWQFIRDHVFLLCAEHSLHTEMETKHTCMQGDLITKWNHAKVQPLQHCDRQIHAPDFISYTNESWSNIWDWTHSSHKVDTKTCIVFPIVINYSVNCICIAVTFSVCINSITTYSESDPTLCSATLETSVSVTCPVLQPFAMTSLPCWVCECEDNLNWASRKAPPPSMSSRVSHTWSSSFKKPWSVTRSSSRP